MMSKTPIVPQGPSPVLGADTDTVLREAGLTDADIAALYETGVVC